MFAKKFGFGSKSGIDIPEESVGIVPSTQYYNKTYGKNGWTKGFVVSLGIGQGELSVTPLQMAQYIGLIASFGKSAKPHFLKSYVEADSNKIINIKPQYYDLGLGRKSFEVVRHALYNVVNRAGTATNIKDPVLNIAGKTGTAQNPHGNDHSVFIGFAPFDNPKIAVAVIVENAGFGSTVAAPIARDIIKAYLIKDKIKLDDKFTSVVSKEKKIEN